MSGLFERIMQQSKAVKEALGKIEITGESGAGMVKVLMNGQYKVKSIVVEDEIFNEGKEVVLDLITSATNEATGKVKEAVKEKMTELMGNFGLPSDLSSMF